jgi:HK97 family phage portal protein
VSNWTAPLRALGRRATIVENRSPVPLAPRIKPSVFGYQPTDDMLSYLEAYCSSPVVRPIVARLFQGVSASVWKLYTKSTSGDPQDRKPVLSHAVLDLLAKPNSFQTWPEIMARGQQHWELVGETSIVLGFQAGIKYPIDMWVLRPDRIQPVPDPYNFLAGWIYKAPGDGERIPLKTTELLRMVDPSPIDPYRGQGAVQSLIRDLDSIRYTKEWQANFFANSAQPGGMISVPVSLSDHDFQQLSKRWNENHGGVSKAHRIGILENATWVQNSFSLKDLQMAELEALGRDKILAAFGMPKGMIGIVEDVNRANAEAGEYLFAADMIKPRLNNWKQLLNQQLLPLFDPQGRLELDFDDPVPENSEANIAERKTNFDVLIAAVTAGFDVDDLLEYLDLPEIGYTKPAVPALGAAGGDFAEGVSSPIQTPDTPANRSLPAVESAMRWVVRGHPDSSCCEPCLTKIGTLYRNRSSAEKDYPPGKGYVDCVGAQYGNHCRCSVVKRRSDRG